MSISAGPPAKTPDGFRDTIDICGRMFQIKYYETITCTEDGDLDGRCITNRREIWIATKDRCLDFIAETLFHEAAAHAPLAYVEDGANNETIVLMLELTQPTILRANPWFWGLFGGE